VLDIAVWHHLQRRFGNVGIGARAAHGFLHGAGLLDQGDGAVEIAFGLIAGLDYPLPEGPVGLPGAGVSQDQRQGHLGLAEIVAHCLAHQCLTAGIVQRVVDQLESDA
jgi:hypothetical protein